MKVIKAIYDFIVGDMIILIGTIIVVALLALIAYVNALSALRPAMGILLIVALLVVLAATLYREEKGNH